ncbi:BTB and MATH domain-containing protein 42-like [Ptychodera flava]|uniref:BTB and MATH domain-containing protein 42-like n=1 Tax=Ptychodera flava TaxID=63121 RepID=UPI00396A84FF
MLRSLNIRRTCGTVIAKYITKSYSKSVDGKAVTPDTWIYVGDACYKVHRDVICEHGEYFKALFSFEGYSESEPKEIELCGRTPTSNALATFLDFIYKRTFSCCDNGVLEFLLAADFLQVTKSFMDALSRSVNKENWGAILEIAVTFESKRLEDAVYKFVETNHSHIQKTKTYKQLKGRHKKLQQILQSCGQSRTDHEAESVIKHYTMGLCRNQQQISTETICFFC